jgi:hypothetical protein
MSPDSRRPPLSHASGTPVTRIRIHPSGAAISVA